MTRSTMASRIRGRNRGLSIRVAEPTCGKSFYERMATRPPHGEGYDIIHVVSGGPLSEPRTALDTTVDSLTAGTATPSRHKQVPDFTAGKVMSFGAFETYDPAAQQDGSCRFSLPRGCNPALRGPLCANACQDSERHATGSPRCRSPQLTSLKDGRNTIPRGNVGMRGARSPAASMRGSAVRDGVLSPISFRTHFVAPDSTVDGAHSLGSLGPRPSTTGHCIPRDECARPSTVSVPRLKLANLPRSSPIDWRKLKATEVSPCADSKESLRGRDFGFDQSTCASRGHAGANVGFVRPRAVKLLAPLVTSSAASPSATQGIARSAHRAAHSPFRTMLFPYGNAEQAGVPALRC